MQAGHDGRIVFRQAFGERKLPGEPGLDGAPAPAEPMTEDTIFDLASLSKPSRPPLPSCSSTNRAGLGSTNPSRPTYRVQSRQRSPTGTGDGTNAAHPYLRHRRGPQPRRPVGANGRRQGGRRTPGPGGTRRVPPGEVFHYPISGSSFSAPLIERITGEPLDVYVRDNVFVPRGMNDTYYLPGSKACGPTGSSATRWLSIGIRRRQPIAPGTRGRPICWPGWP